MAGASGSASGRYGRTKYRRSAGSRRSNLWWLWLVGGGLAVVAAVAILGHGKGAGIPAGTQTFAETNHQHVTGTPTYDRNPPAGGPHNAVWLNCGIYGQPVPNANAVHSLEHGAVWITYLPSLASSEVAELRALVESHYVGPQRYLILSPYPGLPAPVVASAWGAQLQLQSASDPRLVQFVTHFAGGSQGGEPGGACTGGTGRPNG